MDFPSGGAEQCCLAAHPPDIDHMLDFGGRKVDIKEDPMADEDNVGRCEVIVPVHMHKFVPPSQIDYGRADDRAVPVSQETIHRRCVRRIHEAGSNHEVELPDGSQVEYPWFF